MKEIMIRDVCGDYALDLPLDNASTFTLYFNSYQNALNVKRIIEVDRSVPNAATVCDMQEVVRCKDCRFWHKGENEVESWEYCSCNNLVCSADDFCCFGERKAGADDEHIA